MNYINDGYVMDKLAHIHVQQIDIEIDWLDGTFRSASMTTERIKTSIECRCSGLERHFTSQNIHLDAIAEFKLSWLVGDRKFMVAESTTKSTSTNQSNAVSRCGSKPSRRCCDNACFIAAVVVSHRLA